MGYQGRASFDKTTQTLKLDTLASAFNGAQTVFSLTSGNRAIYPATTRNLLISINGVVQEPDAAFTVNGSSITFTSAPAANATFFGVLNGQPNDLVLTPSVQSITVNNTMVVNASGFYAGTNVVANTTTVFVGNSTVNVVHTGSALTVGANVTMNTSTVFVGNSSVNTAITAGSIAVNGGAATLSQTFRGLTLRTHPDADVATSKVLLNHADEIVMHDGTRVADWNNLVADITASGAGGLDTGSEGASRWYEIHAIRKSSDGTKNLLLHRAKDYGADQSNTTVNSTINARRTSAPTRTKLAQGIQFTTSGPVPFVDVLLIKTGSPTGNIWLTLESNSGSNPSAVLATSDKLDASLISTTAQWVRFVFRTPYTQTAATQYHLVLQGDYTTSDDVNNIGWRSNSSTVYANGEARELDSAVWASVGGGGYDFGFKLYVTQNDTAVTMPSGYDQRALIGWVYNNSSSNFTFMQAQDRHVWTSELTVISSGSASFLTFVDMAALLPPVPVTWTVGSFQVSGALSGTVQITPALSYVPYWSFQNETTLVNVLPMAPMQPIEFQYVYYSTTRTFWAWIKGYQW